MALIPFHLTKSNAGGWMFSTNNTKSTDDGNSILFVGGSALTSDEIESLPDEYTRTLDSGRTVVKTMIVVPNESRDFRTEDRDEYLKAVEEQDELAVQDGGKILFDPDENSFVSVN
jgi:hypothetical protein